MQVHFPLKRVDHTLFFGFSSPHLVLVWTEGLSSHSYKAYQSEHRCNCPENENPIIGSQYGSHGKWMADGQISQCRENQSTKWRSYWQQKAVRSGLVGWRLGGRVALQYQLWEWVQSGAKWPDGCMEIDPTVTLPGLHDPPDFRPLCNKSSMYAPVCFHIVWAS